MATENRRHPAIAELTEDGDTFDLSNYCRHCGRAIEDDDGTYYHPDTMSARCDGPDDESGIAWGDLVRQAEPDTRTLRLRIEPDEGNRMPDGDWFGKIAWVEPDRDSIYPRPRPDGFDGRARKIGVTQNHDAVWWQPPDDVDAEHLPAFQRSLEDILDYGYCGLIVELLDGEDAYHRPIVVNAASLWGIEPFPDSEYVAEVVGELIAEVLG